MTTQTKKLLLAGVIAIIGIGLIFKDKIEQTIDIFSKIDIKPNSLPKKIRFTEPNQLGIPQKILFNIDIIIINPDYRELSVSGLGVAKLRDVTIFFKNVLIGTANLQLEEIVVPAKNVLVLKDVAFTGNTLAVGQNATSFLTPKIEDFKFLGTIELLGIDYEIGA